MIVYLEGKFVLKTPTQVWIDINGLAYEVFISLYTYEKIQHLEKGKLLTYLQIKEDGHTLYGFFTENERQLFLLLISVSGVGANTARMMLSSMESQQIKQAILTDNYILLEKIKGIGAKTAKRIILELKDKVFKMEDNPTEISSVLSNNIEIEALNALTSLGIAKNAAQNAIQKVLKTTNEITQVEDLIKQALKNI